MPVQEGVQLVVQLVGSGAGEGCDGGGHISFEDLSVDGADVPRGPEYVLLWRTSDMEMVENRNAVGGKALLDDTRTKHVLLLSVENSV